MEIIECPPISDEWAKQLIFDVAGPMMDFGNVRVYRVPSRSRKWIMPLWDTTYPPRRWPGYDREEIEIGQIYDPLNHEMHRMGCGTRSNTIIVVVQEGE